MSLLHRHTALVALLAAAALTAAAQDTTSPYSKFGYGLLRDNATSAQTQMGGVGYAMRSGRQINVMNPASYAAADSMTFLFDMGVTLSNMWVKDGGVSNSSTGGGLDYITMQFPLARHVGMSIGLLPYSSVGYAFGSNIENGVSTRVGEGGLNQLYLGLGVRPVKGLTAGFNFGYLFGTTYNYSNATSTLGSLSMFTQMMEVRDFHMDFGVQYGIDLGRRHRLTVGVTMQPGKTLLGHTMVTTSETTGTTTVVADTVASMPLKGRFSLPWTWGFGVSYEWDKRLLVEADLTYGNWSHAKFARLDNFISTTYQDRWRGAVGMRFQPAQRGGYFRRVNYRAGAWYDHSYISVGGNSVKEWGLSCGVGLPAPGQKTMINLGLEYHTRRAYPSALVDERYLNITLGVNFCETWFWKNKIR